MGEMADFYNEQIENHLYLMEVDGMEDWPDDWEPNPSKTCRCCKQKGLHWVRKDSKWTLFNDKNEIHKCKVNPLNRK